MGTISIDPIGIEAGDPNFYRYVENSPVNATDPSGLIRQVSPTSGSDASPTLLDRLVGAVVDIFTFNIGPEIDTGRREQQATARQRRLEEFLEDRASIIDIQVGRILSDRDNVLPRHTAESIVVKGYIDQFLLAEEIDDERQAARLHQLFGGGLPMPATVASSAARIAVPRTGQISYGSSDLGQIAIQARRQTGTYSARNAAVVEYRATDGPLRTMTTFSERGVGHAERLLAKDLDALRVQPSQVTRIYTELEACSAPGGYCKDFIGRTYPQAEVTFSFSYGTDAASRRAGVDALREAAGQLRNAGN